MVVQDPASPADPALHPHGQYKDNPEMTVPGLAATE